MDACEASNAACKTVTLAESSGKLHACFLVLGTCKTPDENQIPAGPTAIIDQQYNAVQQRALPDSPSRTALVFPSRNNYVLFDGRLGHGVLGSSSQKPRMTMLINWWADKPQVLLHMTSCFPGYMKSQLLATHLPCNVSQVTGIA